jgi:hypothetical protein
MKARNVLSALLLLITAAPVLAVAPGPLAVKVFEQSGEGPKPVHNARVHIGSRYAATDTQGLATFEGIPAGRYPLLIQQPGYDTLSRPIVLPEGARQAQELFLSPATFTDWGGRLVSAVQGHAIAGVNVDLRPLQVASALSGAAHSVTTWDGEFNFIDVPVGRYRLSARAAGYAELTSEVVVAGVDRSVQAAFDQPQVDGTALDLCREWGSNCGKPAADSFCQSQGYHESAEHRVGLNQPPTRIISSGAVCEGGHCDRIDWVRCVGRAPKPLVLAMQPLSQVVSQALKIIDAVSGQPIRDASVTLAETWPLGRLAAARSDAAGLVRFPGLKLGDVNFEDEDGNVEIARRAITAHIEANGHESRVVPLQLGENAKPVEVLLNPLTEQAEIEPNNEAEQAQTVRTTAAVRFRLAEPGDRDLFRFSLSEPANLVITIAPDEKLGTWMRLLDGDGKALQEASAYPNRPNVIERAATPGSYLLEVAARNQRSDPERTLTLTIVPQPAVDPGEPNASLAAAGAAAVNHQVSGVIWPRGDADFYQVAVAQSGILRIRDNGHPMQRHLQVYSPVGEPLGRQGHYANRPLNLEVAVTPGIYRFELTEWGNDSASLEPYRLQVELLPDDGVVDPEQKPGSMQAVRSLPSHTWFASTLLPVGDRDTFSIDLPGAGVLRMQSIGPMQRLLQVFDARGSLLVESGAYAARLQDLSWHAAGPQTVFVQIREWGDDSYSALPYSMRVWFERGDEIDYVQRNEDFDHAVPAVPGDTLYGSYLPRGDQDFYAVDVDFPGVLEVKARSAHQTLLRVYDAEREMVAEAGAYANREARLSPEVHRGRYFVALSEWGNDDASTQPYQLELVLHRAEPDEREPLAADPPRRLEDGIAQAFSIDQRGDLDRFLFAQAVAGVVNIKVASPVQTLVRVFDQASGEKLHESGHYQPARVNLQLKLDSPTELRIELSEWGNDNTSTDPGFVMVDSRGRALHADRVAAVPDGFDPALVSFDRVALDYLQPAERCELDLDGDGRADLVLDSDKAKSGRLPGEGRFLVQSTCIGPEGQRAVQRFWVQATGNRAREGIGLFVSSPYEGQVVDRPVPLAAHAIGYTGRPVASLSYLLDGRPVATVYSQPYDVEVNWHELQPGAHEVKAVATDSAGRRAEQVRRFSISEYFDISPPDGAVLTGESIRVSWLAPGFGESLLRYRKQGSGEWLTAQGESGRRRSVELQELEPGVPYEIQPLGGSQPGPVYALTRVKGLAFGQARYGANIRRDYDQRVGISVRNNGDEPLSVRLECGQPKDPALLVSFVGEGSEDKPIELAPGRTRNFLLAISAQDVNTADHTIPIRIVSDNGLSDEAEVAVHVRLPRVELEWRDLGPLPLGHGRKLRLHNAGDTVTDLNVSSDDPHAVTISPAIQHGLLEHGRHVDFHVTPRFYEGFKGVASRIVARGLDKTFSHDYAMTLGEGQSVHRVWLFPGQDPRDEATVQRESGLIANAQRAETLDPADIDWSRRENPEDLDGDGRTDRWSMAVGEVRWVGDDTDSDTLVDFVHADVGDDGIFEYSAILEGDRWRKTNLVEAWLEMGFSLPWNRSSYHPHDTDIVLNGVVIGSLRDTIPEGNYSFRIPPQALRFDDTGRPVDNHVGISSKHLRGGHYVVNSDFRFKFRLTATPVWTVAKSEAEARRLVANVGGVSIAAPDLSLSSSELWLDAPLETKDGDTVRVEVPLRNLGSVPVFNAEVALFRKARGKDREEIGRVSVDQAGLHGAETASITWRATPGSGSFVLVADPDNHHEDLDRANNEAAFFLDVKGEAKPPQITFETPQPGSAIDGTHLRLRARLVADAGVVTPAISIDGGLWTELPPASGELVTELLLQPGEHRIELRATDSAGSSATETVTFSVAADLPQARILVPRSGQTINSRMAQVAVEIPDATVLVGVRAGGGPWYRAVLAGREARAELPLRYGRQLVEAMTVDDRGAVSIDQVEIISTVQPRPGEQAQAAGAREQGLVWPLDGSDLALDLFQAHNGVLQPVERPGDDAGQTASAAPGDVMETMDDAQRARYQAARSLREEGGRLQASGQLQEALERYRKSLELYPDHRLESHIRLIEGVVGGSATRASR